MFYVFIHRSLVIFIGLLLVSCGGDSDSPAASNTTLTFPIYAGIIVAMNNPQQRIPASFYQLQQINAGVEHDYFHVRAVDIWSGSTVNYDLASNDSNTASNWMTIAVTARYNNASLIATLENNWYYESTWYANDPYAGHPHYISARVFKATAIDRSVYDVNQPTSLQAVLQQRPATASDISFIAEYLWTFSSENNTGHIVLDSFTETTPLGFRQVIQEAVFDPAHGTTDCVLVDLWDSSYQLNNTTGGIMLTRIYRGSFHARFSSEHGYVVCPTHSPQPATSNGLTTQGTLAVYPE